MIASPSVYTEKFQLNCMPDKSINRYNVYDYKVDVPLQYIQGIHTPDKDLKISVNINIGSFYYFS